MIRRPTRTKPSRSGIAKKVLLAAGASLLLAAVGGEVEAQTPPPDPKQVEAADVAFRRGQTALEAGRLEEACAAFEESLKLDLGVGALLNLARCHRLQGKILQAHREYGQAAELATKAGQAERVSAATAVVTELGAVLPRLAIEAPDPVDGLAITVDGEPVDLAQLAEPRLLEVGPHEVVATAPGHVEWRSTAQVRSAPEPLVVRVPRLERTESASSTATSAPERPPAGDDGLVTGGFIVGGVGVASLVVGSIFGVMTLSDASTARDDPALCPDDHCTKAGRDLVDDAETKGIVSTIGIGVGAAAVAAGVIMIVLGLPDEAAPKSDHARLVSTAGPGDAGFGAALRF